MIIWDDILEQHTIRIGSVHPSFNKYLDGGALPNKNVKVANAEIVIQNVLNPLITDEGYHLYIHIFSFPNKSEPDIPFNYILWLGLIGTEPIAIGGTDNWWESSNE